MQAGQMIIDEQLPRYDVALVGQHMVNADPATTFRAAHELDFLPVRTPPLTIAMWLRVLPDAHILSATVATIDANAARAPIDHPVAP
jgi:hypothetical protein